jgi:hypothetical protein
MPIGDSMTRGSYLRRYETGPFAGQPIGLPHPGGGGWRKPLQDRLRAAGIPYVFVGSLDYFAFGRDGIVDPAFSPAHHGLAGFGNAGILAGGAVPTPQDILTAEGVSEIRVPCIEEALHACRPDIVLLLSGANGFDLAAWRNLVDAILAVHSGPLLAATIPPQRPPRLGWDGVEKYNRGVRGGIAALARQGRPVFPVDLHAAVRPDDLVADGVHPNRDGMDGMAAAWWDALQPLLAKAGHP